MKERQGQARAPVDHARHRNSEPCDDLRRRGAAPPVLHGRVGCRTAALTFS